MRHNMAEVGIGALVIAAAAYFMIFAAGAAQLGQGGNGSYGLQAAFRSVDGVSPGTDVRMAGVKIGVVSSMSLNQQSYQAELDMAIESDILVPDDSAILISSDGLLGGAFVEVIPGGSLTNFAPGDAFTDTQGAVSLINLLMKVVASD